MADRYMITHSLLASWLYMFKENPFEDASMETRDTYAEFLTVLRREPTETTEAMQNGRDFEDLVTDIANGRGDPKNPWYDAAAQIAVKCKGGAFQYKASKTVTIRGMSILLYGRLDVLRAGGIYDIKFTKSYDRGKYIESTQHPMYFEILPEAQEFSYLVSDGNNVWTETYRRDEAPSIFPVICDFFDYLTAHDLMEVYKEHWRAA